MNTSLSRVVAASVLLLISVGAFSAPITNAKKGKPAAPAAADCSKVDDATLTSQVTAKVSETVALVGQDIKVEAKSGVVTLTGTVSSSAKKRLATSTAVKVSCVKRVRNLLLVKHPIGADYLCCCDGVCWHQSTKCPLCLNIKDCVEAYKAALAAAGGNNDAIAAAREAFHACTCKASSP